MFHSATDPLPPKRPSILFSKSKFLKYLLLFVNNVKPLTVKDISDSVDPAEGTATPIEPDSIVTLCQTPKSFPIFIKTIHELHFNSA